MLAAQAIILVLTVVYFLASTIMYIKLALDVEFGEPALFYRKLKRVPAQILFAVGSLYILTQAGTFDVVCDGPPFKNDSVQVEPGGEAS